MPLSLKKQRWKINLDELINVSSFGQVMVISICRPQKANALTVSMQVRITSEIAQKQELNRYAAFVIYGGEGKNFSAGADVKEKPADVDRDAFMDRRSSTMFDLIRTILNCKKPIVAALNGDAVGSGFLIALSADAIVYVEGVKVSLPELNFDRPTFAGIDIVNYFLNRSIAKRMVLSGAPMTMDKLRSVGVFAENCQRGEVLANAVKLAALLAQKPNAFQLNKKAINQNLLEKLHESQKLSRLSREL